MTDFNNILAEVIAYTDLTIMNIVFALVVMVVGFFAAKMIVQMFKSGMEKTKLPVTQVKKLLKLL